MTRTILALPNELLISICKMLAYDDNCKDREALIDAAARHRGLVSLGATCNRLGDLARPLAYRSLVYGFLLGNNKRPIRRDCGLELLARTLMESPLLANQVRSLAFSYTPRWDADGGRSCRMPDADVEFVGCLFTRFDASSKPDDFYSCSRLDEYLLVTISSVCQNLKDLSLRVDPGTTWPHSYRRLRTISVLSLGSNVRPRAFELTEVASLLAATPNLVALNLSDCRFIGGTVGLASRRIKSISLRDCVFEDKNLVRLTKECPVLEHFTHSPGGSLIPYGFRHTEPEKMMQILRDACGSTLRTVTIEFPRAKTKDLLAMLLQPPTVLEPPTLIDSTEGFTALEELSLSHDIIRMDRNASISRLIAGAPQLRKLEITDIDRDNFQSANIFEFAISIAYSEVNASFRQLILTGCLVRDPDAPLGVLVTGEISTLRELFEKGNVEFHVDDRLLQQGADVEVVN